MNHLKTNHSFSSRCLPVRMTLAALAVLALASIPVARASEDNRAPDLPSPLCDRLQVPPGNKVAFHVYALGVQIYRWNGTSWEFVAPAATLFADADYHGEVGIHYAGPTWESHSGGKVIASRLEGCTPDPAAIPWLLLPDRLDRRPRHFPSRDLHPAGEHHRRFSSYCSRLIHRR